MSEHIKSTTRLLTPEEKNLLAVFLIDSAIESYDFLNKLFNKAIKFTDDEKIDLFVAHKCSNMMLIEFEDHDFNMVVKFHAGYVKSKKINHFTETFVVSKDFKTILNVSFENYDIIPMTLEDIKLMV